MWSLGNEWNYNGLYVDLPHAECIERIDAAARRHVATTTKSPKRGLPIAPNDFLSRQRVDGAASLTMALVTASLSRAPARGPLAAQ